MSTKVRPYTPVFIIGCPRSGTNILRDVLASHPSISTWPCDELNQLWRYKYYHRCSDVLTADDINSSNRNYIYSAFDSLHSKTNTPFILEKTCANTLRIPFLSVLFPWARFIHITRDGHDASYSAFLSAQSKVNLYYIFRKLRFIPLSGLLPYFKKYLSSYFSRHFSSSAVSSLWGPVYPGMFTDSRTLSPLELYAKQWATCNMISINDLAILPTSVVHHITYEDFTRNPQFEVTKILHFLGLDLNPLTMSSLIHKVNPSSIGKAVRELPHNDFVSIASFVKSF